MKYLKQLALLGLFLFVTIYNSMATNFTYQYSYWNIVNNEKTITLDLKFSDLSERVKNLNNAAIRVRFWNDPQCKNEIKGSSYVSENYSGFKTSYEIDLSSIPFEENLIAKYGNNYIGSVPVYFSIDIIKSAVGQKGIVINGASYVIVESFSPSLQKENTYKPCIDYSYIIPKVKNQGSASLIISYPSDKYTKEHPITKLDNFKVVVSFWKDSKRKDPLNFYISSKRKTTEKNPEVFTEIPDTKEILPEESFFETNELERTRHNWNEFMISDLPAGFLDEVGVPFLKSGQAYNDTIYFAADVYDMDNNLLNRSFYWHSLARREFGAPCSHQYEKSQDTKYEERIVGNGCYILKLEIKQYFRICKLCGHKYQRKFTTTRKYRNPAAPPSCIDKNKQEKDEDKKNDENDVDSKEEENGKNNDMIDGNSQDANLFISYEEERKDSVLPPQNGLNRTKVDRELYKVDLENNTREKVGSYTEVEWEEMPPCHPHDMKTSDGRMAKCSKCGTVDYNNKDTYKDMPAEQCKDELAFDINGVKLNMRLIKDDFGSDPVYVAETETTQGLWAAVFPNDWHSWDKNSEFPASNITYQDATIFINNLNHLAEVNNWPVEFELPTVGEWLYVYENGGKTKEGWNADNSYNWLHPVRSFAPSSKGIYDMNGSVQEMTCEVRRGEKKEYADPLDVRALLQNDWEMAVCGNGIYDPTGSVDLTKERWGGLGISKDVGLRIFAIPIKR